MHAVLAGGILLFTIITLVTKFNMIALPFSQDTTDRDNSERPSGEDDPQPEPQPINEPSPGYCQLNWSCFKKVSNVFNVSNSAL